MDTGAHQRVMVAEAKTSPTSCLRCVAIAPEALAVRPRRGKQQDGHPIDTSHQRRDLSASHRSQGQDITGRLRRATIAPESLLDRPAAGLVGQMVPQIRVSCTMRLPSSSKLIFEIVESTAPF